MPDLIRGHPGQFWEFRNVFDRITNAMATLSVAPVNKRVVSMFSCFLPAFDLIPARCLCLVKHFIGSGNNGNKSGV